MTGRVLHLLSQRPHLTGSGVTLDALTREADRAGWRQAAVVGIPSEEPEPTVGPLSPEDVLPLRFGGPELPFRVPGMSDVMPYPSTRFRDMTGDQLERYLDAWTRQVADAVGRFRPDLVHSHHLWLLSSLVKVAAPSTPVVVHCHATGLRQMELAPHLAEEVRRGNRRNDRFVVLTRDHARRLSGCLKIAPSRVTVVGAGYREDLFHTRGRRPGSNGRRLVYVGKLSRAKGLPWLLEAFERLAVADPELELHVAGSGGGPEAEELRRRIARLAPRVIAHGHLDQARLAELLRRASVCVLPSFYEGLPLVLAEAAACGCRVVATALDGVVAELAPAIGGVLLLVAPPRLVGPDRPVPEDLPAFVDRLAETLAEALAAPPVDRPPRGLAELTWAGVFRRVEAVWRLLLRPH